MNDAVFLRSLADRLEGKGDREDAGRLRKLAEKLSGPVTCRICAGTGLGPHVQGFVGWNRAMCPQCHGEGKCLPFG